MAPLTNLAALLLLPAVALAAPAPVSVKPQIFRTEQGGFQIDALPPNPIVGGTTAALGEFPYIVSLSQGGSHFCGGSLLNAYTVLTAAHCSVDTAASSVKVRAGTTTWASGGKQVGVSKIVVYPSYNAGKTDQDVALWHLSTPLTQSSSIGYVTLPAQGSDPATGTVTTVAGWGLTSESGQNLPSTLRKVNVPVVSRTECKSDYGSSAITTNMWCAAYPQGGKDSCSGDSGGPIIDASSKVLLGTVSWGQGCAKAGYPGVYSRVGNYVSWINSNKWTS